MATRHAQHAIQHGHHRPSLFMRPSPQLLQTSFTYPDDGVTHVYLCLPIVSQKYAWVAKDWPLGLAAEFVYKSRPGESLGPVKSRSLGPGYGWLLSPALGHFRLSLGQIINNLAVVLVG